MEMRLADHTIILKCANSAQKSNRYLHVFCAAQFRSRWRVGKRNMMPVPPSRDDDWWLRHYRLRLDGKWLSNGAACKYRFFTMEEIMHILQQLMEGNNAS